MLLFFVIDIVLLGQLFDLTKQLLGLPKSAGEKVFAAALYERFRHPNARPASLVVRLISLSCDGTIWFFGPFFAGLFWEEPIAWPLLVHCFLAPAVTELCVKSIFKRPRPSHNTRQTFIAPGEKYSFPSGHSTRAHAIATLCSMSASGIGSKVSVHHILILHIWAVAISYSRVALGRHYPSDVVAGHAAGTMSSIISRGMFHLDELFHPPWQFLRNILLSTRFASCIRP